MNPTGNADVDVAVTGTAWIGRGVVSVNGAIERMIERAEDEVQIVAYELTEGADEFPDLLRSLLARGIQVTMIVNRLNEKHAIRGALTLLAERFPQFQLFSFDPPDKSEDLHAKVIVCDRKEALVGSANLSRRGMVRNHELAVTISGKPASTVAGLIDRLCLDSRVVRVR